MIAEGIAIGVSKMIYDMYQSDKLDAQASATSLKAMNRSEEAKARLHRKIEDTKVSMLRLGNRKKGILTSTMETFLTVYQQLKKINFTKTDGITELSDLPAAMIQEVRSQISFVGNPMSDGETVATVVVNSFFFGGLGGISAAIKKDAERNLGMARATAKQAKAMETQANTLTLAYDAIIERSNRVTDVLTKLNLLLVKSLAHTKLIIEKNGTDKHKYSVVEREGLATCINLAVAVKKIIDTPLLDEGGEITVQSFNAIQVGEQYLQEISFEINQ